ncbi:LamB/YcsF family protein [Halobacillus fulvus]|nr:LamB/YcsF family protein [Halobacillus fulvus]
MYTVDLNCDMGESFGAYTIGRDREILDYITSANIACGFHAGDPSVMKETVKMAVDKQVAIGAHPGLPDLVGFGRRKLDISPDEAYDMTLYQIGALKAFVEISGSKLQHVKPHGALFNMAAKDRELADAIAKAVYDLDHTLILFGLAGSELIHAGNEKGLRVASEVFSDRTYQKDGSLTPRREPNAVITDRAQAVNQVIRMIKEGRVQTVEQNDIAIAADTVCIHGDGEHAVEFASEIHQSFKDAGIHTKKISDI